MAWLRHASPRGRFFNAANFSLTCFFGANCLKTSIMRVARMRLPKPDLVFRKGKLASVILPIRTYCRLLESIEDAEDVRWLANARKRQMHFRPLENYLSEHRNNSK